mmetsp:Transcript_7915/g.18062  ORF Transcript_7915/g.18062 Transcript_7915/m.18062 type:complete len:261 (+) Transcript_7915:896-1678(+)
MEMILRAEVDETREPSRTQPRVLSEICSFEISACSLCQHTQCVPNLVAIVSNPEICTPPFLDPAPTSMNASEESRGLRVRPLLLGSHRVETHRGELLGLAVHLLPERLLSHQRHLHCRLAPVLSVIVPAVQVARPLHDLLLVEAVEHAVDHGGHGAKAHVHDARRHGVGDVLEVERLALDEDAAADDGVDGARHGEETGGVRELVRSRDLLDEDVVGFDLALGAAGLDSVDEVRDVLVVPPRSEHADPNARAVEFRERDF